jgi:hypothetical protein
MSKNLKDQYAALADMGFLPDTEGRVWCGPFKHKLRKKEKHKDVKSPCTTICFYPIGSKNVRLLGVAISSRNIQDINRLAYFKNVLQAKKHTAKAPSLWETKEIHIDTKGEKRICSITPTAAWPFDGRPCHEFLVAESIKSASETGGTNGLANLTAYLGDMATASIVALDPSWLMKLAKCVEVLKKQEASKPEMEKASMRRVVVMKALEALCFEFKVPPTKQELRFRSDKISAGMKCTCPKGRKRPKACKCCVDPLGAKAARNNGALGMDDKQFTRELINPLGLYWLPEASHNRRK